MTAARVRPLPVLTLLVALGCAADRSTDADLSPDEAAQTLEQHLRAVAPRMFETSDLRMAVHEIVSTSDSTRRVRFGPRPSRFTRVGSRSPRPQFEAEFTLGASGWTLSAYGPVLSNYVAGVVDWHWREGYLPLMAVVRQVRMVENGWYQGMIAEAYRFPMPYDQRADRLLEQARAGIPLDTLHARLEQYRFSPPDSVEWGISPPGAAGIRVIWARFRDDSTVVCGSPYGRFGPLPAGYEWVTDVLTCKGGEPPIYVEGGGREMARARIAHGGGVLRR